MTTYFDVIHKAAPLGSAGYQIEVQLPGQLPVLLPRQAYFSLQPFQNPEGVPQGRHRVLFCQTSGERANLDPGTDVYVDLDFGLKDAQRSQQHAEAEPEAEPEESDSEVSERDPLPAHLHPAAETDESLEREVRSQHIERNEYGNFKLRAETQAIEVLYSVIKRMTADQHVLFQTTLETPRRVTQECKQLVETMGEAMRSFHSMVELQSMTMQAVQKQMELTRVPAPPPPPPDYVGLGKTLLEILRDLGMKAMDSGYMRRPLPARRAQELPEIRDAEVREPSGQDRQEQPDEPAQSEPQGAAGADGDPQVSVELRRVLARMGDVDVARAFQSPESLKDFLVDIQREIAGDRKPAAVETRLTSAPVKTPASACAKAPTAAASQSPAVSGKTPPLSSGKTPPLSSGKTPPPISSGNAPPLSSGKTPPLSSGKTPPPSSGKAPIPVGAGKVSPVPSAQTLHPPSVQTPSLLKQVEPSGDSRSPQGQKRG